MNNYRLNSLSVGVFFFIAIIFAQAAGPAHARTLALKVQQAQPSAPMVACTIRMNYWCLVKADANLNMSDHGDYRIWKISAPVGNRELVTTRESKSCDSPADVRPARKFEKDERSASGEHRHTVEVAITSDGACTLRVDYIAGVTDLARESLSVAMYRLYLCSSNLCSRPLLSVE